MATTIGKAVIIIEADATRFTGDLDRKLGTEGAKAGEAAGKRTGWTFMKHVGANLVSNVLTQAAGAAGNLISQAFSLGMGRLVAIDDARGKLRGLGHDAGSVDTIMKSALASVKGTAFGLGDAATLAATAVAAGIKPGEQLTARLKLTGDAATIAGTSLDQMGSIFGKVQTAQRAYTAELNQLADRGIPIYQWLQEELGVSAEELRKMVSQGQVDSETFFRVIQENIGGAALEAGQTFSGSLENVKAAIGRLGAAFLEPAFEQMPEVFAGLIEALDGLAPAAETVGTVLGGMFAGVVEGAAGLVGFIRENETAFSLLAAVVVGGAAAFATYRLAMSAWLLVTVGIPKALAAARVAMIALNAAMRANPIGLIITAIGALVGALVWLWNNNETFRKVVTAAWNGIKAAVGAVVGWFTGTVVPFFVGIWEKIAGGGGGPSVITRAWEGIKDFFQGLWDGIVAGVTWFIDLVVGLFLKFHPLGMIIANWEPIVAFFTDLWARVSGAIMAGLNAIWAVIEPWVTWFMGVFQAAWGVLQFLILLPIRLAQIAVTAAWGAIVAAFQWAADWVAGVFMAIWGAIGPPIMAVIDAVRDGISAAWQWITDRFSQAWAWISGVFMAWWNTLSAIIGAVLDAVVAWVTMTWNNVIALFTNVWSWISGVFMGWYRTLSALIGAVMDAVLAWIRRIWDNITERFSAAWSWVSGTFMGWWNTLAGLMETPIRLAREAIDRILDGIKSGFEAAVNFIKDVWDRIPEIVSAPVRIAIRVGNALIGGFRTVAKAVGLDDIAGKLVDIPPLPAMRSGGRTDDIVPGSPRLGPDSTLGVLSDGMPWVRVDPGEGIVRKSAMDDFDRQYGKGWLDGLNRGRLPGFFQGGRMPTSPGRISVHPQPYHGTRYAADMARPANTPVYAWHAGTVAQIRHRNTSYGHDIVLNHAPNIGRSRYAHLMPGSMSVAVGQQVAQGQRIAGVDSTGNSTGHHLHFEIMGGNQPISQSAEGGGGGFFDWVGDLLGKFSGPLKELDALGDSTVAQIAKKVPKMVADGMVEKIRDAAGAFMDGAGSTAPPVSGGPLTGIGVTANTAAKGGEIAATTRAAGHRISSIGGYRGDGEHVTRRALDFMVGGKAAGDFISSFVLGNRGRYGLQHVIWWQRINSGTGWRGMNDRGSPTQNHMDHPHVLFNSRDLPLDTGGWLPTGRTVTNNQTGRAEAVLTGRQWDNVDGILSLLERRQRTETESKRGGVTINVEYKPTIDPHAVNPRREYERFSHDFMADVETILR